MLLLTNKCFCKCFISKWEPIWNIDWVWNGIQLIIQMLQRRVIEWEKSECSVSCKKTFIKVYRMYEVVYCMLSYIIRFLKLYSKTFKQTSEIQWVTFHEWLTQLSAIFITPIKFVHGHQLELNPNKGNLESILTPSVCPIRVVDHNLYLDKFTDLNTFVMELRHKSVWIMVLQ